MDKEFEILKEIQRVEAPAFLYARILNAIQRKQEEIVSIKWIVGAASFLLIVFALNITTIQTSKKSNEIDLTEIFALKSQNLFYDEEK